MLYFSRTELLVSKQDLQDFAWSAPLRDLAPSVGLSDVGLAKQLKTYGVVTPPRGHWIRVRGGLSSEAMTPPWTRRPGENHLVRVDSRFSAVLPSRKPMPSSGPFSSESVPEDLEELYLQELAAVRHLLQSPKKSRGHHMGLSQLIQHEQQRRADKDKLLFDNLLDRRRLYLLDELHTLMSARGFQGSTFERDNDLETIFRVGDSKIRLLLRIQGESQATARGGRSGAPSDLPLSTPLTVSAYFLHKRDPSEIWEDGPNRRLEKQLQDIVARTITLGEASYRLSLAELEEREARDREERAARQRQEVERRNAERLKSLHISGDLLRQAYDLRVLIERVRSAAIAGALEIDDLRLQEWEQWAQAEADRLDPVISGQIMSHLLPKLRIG